MAIENATGVFVRDKKLIFKGKVISSDPNAKLVSLNIGQGSKVMLMAPLASSSSSSSHSSQQQAQVTKGQLMAQDLKRQRQEEARAKIEAIRRGGGSTNNSLLQSTSLASMQLPQLSERQAMWTKTKIIALRGLGLESLPEDLLHPSSCKDHSKENKGVGEGEIVGYKAMDLSENKLKTLPSSIFIHLQGLNFLRLNDNQLGRGEGGEGEGGEEGGGGGGPPEWMEPCSMHLGPSLRRLHLDNNPIAIIPEAFFDRLVNLQHLSLGNNALTRLPESLGKMTRLETLHVDRNKIEHLPSSIGQCVSLTEIDASSNLIASLPSALSSLKGLQVLRLAHNRISALPPDLLSSLTLLHTLSCESNPITLDQLRAAHGFEDYEARRRARVDKQLEGGALFNANRSMAQGADQELYERWK